MKRYFSLALLCSLCAAPASAQLVQVDDDKITLLAPIYFKSGRADVLQKSFDLLRELAGALVDTPRFERLRVEGHTDSQGSNRANLKLSQLRAEAVAKALITFGVAGGRLDAVGFGESKPIAPNTTAAGRKRNRRVEVVVESLSGRVVNARPPLAKLTSRRAEVRSRAPVGGWSEATVGQPFHRKWRVETLERSAAGITFRDASSIEMRDRSLVIIYGATGERVRRYAGRAFLESGALMTRLGELEGQPTKVLVETAAGNAELDAGSALVSLDDAGASVVSNFEGAPATLIGKSKSGKTLGRVKIKKGYGARAKKGKAPSKPRKLPPAPQVESAQSVVIVEGKTATIPVRWSAVKDAKTYRLSLRSKQPGESPIAATFDGATLTTEMRDVPVGAYEVQVSVVDTEGYESPASTSKRVRVAALTRPGAGPLLVGETLTAPDGVLCAIAEASPSKTLTVPKDATSLRCVVDDEAVTVAVERPREIELLLVDATPRPAGMEHAIALRVTAPGVTLDPARLSIKPPARWATPPMEKDGALNATVMLAIDRKQQKSIELPIYYDDTAWQVTVPVRPAPPVVEATPPPEPVADSGLVSTWAWIAIPTAVVGLALTADAATALTTNGQGPIVLGALGGASDEAALVEGSFGVALLLGVAVSGLVVAAVDAER